MINKLFVFGCSYTDSCKDCNEDYKKWRNDNLPLSWSEILAKNLNLQLKNYGKGGTGNQKIFKTFYNHISEINENDIVIIQWSYIHRYEWAIPSESEFISLGVGKINEVSTNIKQSTHDEIIMNRTSIQYYNEIYDMMDFIIYLSKIIKFKIFFWSGAFGFFYGEEKINKYKNNTLLDTKIKFEETFIELVLKNGGQRIKEETNNEINDLHLGELGHQVLSELFYQEIKEKLKTT